MMLPLLLVWADLLSEWQDITGWGENDRGVSFTFGGDVVRQFLKKHKFSLITRAHQVYTAIMPHGFVNDKFVLHRSG